MLDNSTAVLELKWFVMYMDNLKDLYHGESVCTE